MIQKKKFFLSRTQENVDIMTSRPTRVIFITKDAIWDDMLPPLLILFKYELGSLTNGHFYHKGPYLRRYVASSICFV